MQPQRRLPTGRAGGYEEGQQMLVGGVHQRRVRRLEPVVEQCVPVGGLAALAEPLPERRALGRRGTLDVMQAAGIGYPTRMVGFLLASAVLGGFTAAGARMLLKQDGLGRREIQAARAELRRRDDPALLRAIVDEGCDKARAAARETMRDVRDAMGLVYD